jgi:hypothetical protein
MPCAPGKLKRARVTAADRKSRRLVLIRILQRVPAAACKSGFYSLCDAAATAPGLRTGPRTRGYHAGRQQLIHRSLAFAGGQLVPLGFLRRAVACSCRPRNIGRRGQPRCRCSDLSRQDASSVSESMRRQRCRRPSYRFGPCGPCTSGLQSPRASAVPPLAPYERVPRCVVTLRGPRGAESLRIREECCWNPRWKTRTSVKVEPGKHVVIACSILSIEPSARLGSS